MSVWLVCIIIGMCALGSSGLASLALIIDGYDYEVEVIRNVAFFGGLALCGGPITLALIMFVLALFALLSPLLFIFSYSSFRDQAKDWLNGS